MTPELPARLRAGVVIPAHPLALDSEGQIDLRAQRALTRYYLAAGAHGVAVGVHTTQFELHHDHGALKEVWELTASTAAESKSEGHRTNQSPAGGESPVSGKRPILVAGLTGDTANAVAEAELALEAGYQTALLSAWGMREVTEEALLERARAVGEVMPTLGFYLQDSVGGQKLSRQYWRRLFDLESVIGVKTAPFDRYRTNDVAQALLDHDRWDEIALITGNDDTIVHDLITPYRRTVNGQPREVRATGGLLGQWAVGTRAAVELQAAAHDAVAAGTVPLDLLRKAADLVDVNAPVFDVDHDFAGVLAGVNEVLRQQGLVATANCLGQADVLSPGQADAIAQARARHPWLLDEEFMAAHRDEWLG